MAVRMVFGQAVRLIQQVHIEDIRGLYGEFKQDCTNYFRGPYDEYEPVVQMIVESRTVLIEPCSIWWLERMRCDMNEIG